MSLIGSLVDKLLKTGSITLIRPGREPATYGRQGGKHLTVRFTDRKVAFDIVKNPRLGVGEAYMNGRLIVEDGTILDLLEMIVGSNRWEDGGNSRKAIKRGKKRFKWLFSRNRAARSKRNVAHHYDLKDELYEFFLDDDRQYSCAYFTDPANSLEQAQADKKAHIAAKLYLQPGKTSGMKVLDIGCGWGGLALYLHKHYGCEVLGVALAPDQIAFCKERAKAEGVADKVKFALMDYRDVEGEFDRISSVGLLEHVGTPHYPQFYKHTHKLLKPDGVMFSHCCGRAGAPGFTDAWTRKYIFPGGYIPALSELVTQSEQHGWQVMDVEAMRFHYSHTLEEWYNRTVMHKDEIVEMYDETFYRMWQFYLAGAEQSFRHGKMVNWQIVYVKDRAAIPMTRDFMVEESARLRASDTAPAPNLDPELREAAE